MRPHGSGSSPCSVSISVFQSRKIIARKLHHPEISHPFFRGKWDPDTLFYLSHKLPDGRMSPSLDAQVHSRLCPLDSRCKIRVLIFCLTIFLLSPVSPPRFHTALSVPKVPICEQPPAPVTVHTYADCNRILPMLRIPNRQNLLPPRFHTALSVPKCLFVSSRLRLLRSPHICRL